jgi:hypothetical protein
MFEQSIAAFLPQKQSSSNGFDAAFTLDGSTDSGDVRPSP